MAGQAAVREITAGELSARRERGERLVILDVREPHELDICRLDNTAHVPLGQLAERLAELEPYRADEIIVYCRSGKRSERACLLLSQAGFSCPVNLKGGILAWADEVDPTLARY